MIPFCFSAARHLRGWTEPGRRYPLGLRTCNLWPRRAAEKQKQGGRVAVLQTCHPYRGLTWTAGPKAEKLFHSKQRRTVSWGFLLIFSQLLREYEPAFAAFDFTPRLHEPRLTDQHHRSVSPPAIFRASHIPDPASRIPHHNHPPPASNCCTEIPRNSKSRRMVSSIKLLGQDAPAVMPTVTLPIGSQSGDPTSSCLFWS